jgi:hypothetical protein
MELNLVKEIINDYSLDKINSSRKRLLNEYFLPNKGQDIPPIYRQLNLGYYQDVEGEYKVVINIFSKRSRTLRLAKELLDKIGEGSIQRTMLGRSIPRFLSGRKNYPFKINGFSIGAPISNKRNSYGSTGAFLVDQNNQEYALSCGHVLKHNLYYRTRQAYTGPSQNLNNHCIGDIIKYNAPKRFKINDPDVAIVKIQNNSYTGNVSNHYNGQKIIHSPSFSYDTLSRGTKVFKYGANTLDTTGVYKQYQKNASIWGRYLFKDVIVVSQENSVFGLPGDSGSLVWTEQNGQLIALGIIFAEALSESVYRKKVGSSLAVNPKEFYICPINVALNHLDLNFL